MKLTATDEQTLDALVSEHAESRSPVQTMIVQAACNARASSDQRAVRTSLSRLKAVGFVARTASDRWIPTKSGITRATGLQAGMEEDAMRNDKTETAPSEVSAASKVEDSASTNDQEAEEVVTIRVVNASEGMVSMEVPADSPAATIHRESQPRPEPVAPSGESLPTGDPLPNGDSSSAYIVEADKFSIGVPGGSGAHDILERAGAHMRDRAATYDKPEGERSMGAAVGAFQEITGLALTEEQGWLFMTLLKAVRSQQGGYRADSYEDGAAYFALAGEAAGRDRQ